jgi:phosphate transport system substrate-binding protein
MAAGALVLVACGRDPELGALHAAVGGHRGGGGLSGTLAGGGASSQESAMQAWIAGFQWANPGVSMSYDPIGSGGGRTQFLEGAFPFVGSDSPMDEEERAQSRERCGGEPAIHLPLYISPIAVIYNLDGVHDLRLSPRTLALIFDRRITRWDDPAIAADNPGVALPGIPVSPVSRSDESGTTSNFTDYLSEAAGDAWPHEPGGEWPVSGGQSGLGTSGVVQVVQGGAGAIGYGDASKAGNLGTARIRVGDGYVAPSPAAAARVVDVSPRAGADGTDGGTGGGPRDLRIRLARDTAESGAYPIVLVAYEILCTRYDDAAEGALVKAFLTYVASRTGQDLAARTTGSAPISDELRAEVTAALEAVTVG